MNRRSLDLSTVVFAGMLVVAAGGSLSAQTPAVWEKYAGNPVLGGELGTCFDISVLREDGRYRMWFSWRPKKSIALVESDDGIHWNAPRIVLPPREETGWEDDINRPCVLRRGDRWEMWYTGQADDRSWIGRATSPDGVRWERSSDRPVLAPEAEWEKVAVMCPHVMWDEALGRYRMWYSGGEQNEPNAIGYATSVDGLAWTREPGNPIFRPDPDSPWEQHKVTAAQVVFHDGWYTMFYIGFENEERARICLARSRDGVRDWQRHAGNPIIRPDMNRWDADACYKPYAIFDGRRWLLWYNGRRGGVEQIGLAILPGSDLGFGKWDMDRSE